MRLSHRGRACSSSAGCSAGWSASGRRSSPRPSASASASSLQAARRLARRGARRDRRRAARDVLRRFDRHHHGARAERALHPGARCRVGTRGRGPHGARQQPGHARALVGRRPRSRTAARRTPDLLGRRCRSPAAAYLLWLGVDALRHRHAHAAGHDQARGRAPRALRVVRQGFTVGVLNPKSLVFFAAVFPHFVDSSRGTITVQLLVFGAIFSRDGLLQRRHVGPHRRDRARVALGLGVAPGDAAHDRRGA